MAQPSEKGSILRKGSAYPWERIKSIKLGILAPNWVLHSMICCSVAWEGWRRNSWQISRGYSPRLVMAVVGVA